MSDQPLPNPRPWSEPFWEGTREGRLLLQECRDCGETICYPKKYCPECGSADLGWRESSGRGTIYTYSTIRKNPPSAFEDELPYTTAIVELEEGVRMMSMILSEPEGVACGVPVEVEFEQVTAEISLPRFSVRDE